ncbi:protein kinase domain-containing protein [Pajaroellobacter abortibovis]|uniref:Protein kinase domain-containing protein n=1 Tax=Pajaroellobacter abortibovis TaxID=1882918 RepID=A0A1L6MY66_9BACT|nr:serine/threonine-protein kinase [Pajaroellobacter abortibovis]APS00397.1 hypothetical protein BCY86_06680 [Pajaroellobacter abortibovis]
MSVSSSWGANRIDLTPHPSPEDLNAPVLPRSFHRFFLLKRLAQGGMGDVYLAATRGIKEAEFPCIVKTIRKAYTTDSSFLARFFDEARIQSQLNHSGVARVFEASVDENNQPYTVVEYVEGHSLSQVQRRAYLTGIRLDWTQAVAIALEIALALAYIHQRTNSNGTPLGIIHRDLSPQNIMISYAGEVKLIDFGTAHARNRHCETVAGTVFAKPGYVAPEVAREEKADQRVDLYALGIILWELCQGRRLVSGDPHKHLERISHGEIRIPPIANQIGAPPLLDHIVTQLTHNLPECRYANASLAVSDLARALATSGEKKAQNQIPTCCIANLMHILWPHEPRRSQAEFASLLGHAQGLQTDTPQEKIASSSKGEEPKSTMFLGTPYRLLGLFGKGGSSLVYKAEHQQLKRKVALKILKSNIAATGQGIAQFREEARVLAQFSHPNLPALFESGRSEDGWYYHAMEWIEGKSLDQILLHQGAIDWCEATRIIIEASKALEAAHAKGIIHGDIKPHHLLLTQQGEVKIIDFGVAAAFKLKEMQANNSSPPCSEPDFSLLGTPNYMAPEQIQGGSIQMEADLYALGCVLYHMITSTPPFAGATPLQILAKKLNQVPPSPSQYKPDGKIPRSLETVLLRTLERKPENRFRSARQLREALEAIHFPHHQETTSSRKNKTIASILGLAAMVLILVQLLHHNSSKSPSPQAIKETPITPPSATKVRKDRLEHDR